MKLWQSLPLLALCLAARTAWAAPLSAAVFPFELMDTSLQGEMQGAQPAEQARLRHLDAELRDLLAQSGEYRVVALGPVAQQASGEDLRVCDACAVDLARRAGAQVAVVGWVQKVSNLILNINLVIRDVPSGKMIHAGSVDIRGNTDESWSRGLRYLLRNRILTPADSAAK